MQLLDYTSCFSAFCFSSLSLENHLYSILGLLRIESILKCLVLNQKDRDFPCENYYLVVTF